MKTASGRWNARSILKTEDWVSFEPIPARNVSAFGISCPARTVGRNFPKDRPKKGALVGAVPYEGSAGAVRGRSAADGKNCVTEKLLNSHTVLVRTTNGAVRYLSLYGGFGERLCRLFPILAIRN